MIDCKKSSFVINAVAIGVGVMLFSILFYGNIFEKQEK